MTNSAGYYSGYGAYEENSHDAATPRATGTLWLAVSVLGLGTFGVSFGTPVLLGWTIWFSVLAAVTAAVGLIPHQRTHGWIVVTFAVTGFLNALSTWFNTEQAGWALVVIVVLNALQAAAAVAALLLAGDTESVGDSGPDYAAYAQYAQAYQAYQAYAMQYQQGPAPQSSAAGQAAHAQGGATVQGRGSTGARGGAADAAQESYEAIQQRYAQYSGNPAAVPHRGSAGAPAVGPRPDAGIPNYGRGTAAPQPPGAPQKSSGESSSN